MYVMSQCSHCRWVIAVESWALSKRSTLKSGSVIVYQPSNTVNSSGNYKMNFKMIDFSFKVVTPLKFRTQYFMIKIFYHLN